MLTVWTPLPSLIKVEDQSQHSLRKPYMNKDNAIGVDLAANVIYAGVLSTDKRRLQSKEVVRTRLSNFWLIKRLLSWPLRLAYQ